MIFSRIIHKELKPPNVNNQDQITEAISWFFIKLNLIFSKWNLNLYRYFDLEFQANF